MIANREVRDLLHCFTTSRRQFLRASALAGGLAAAGGLSPASVAGLSAGRAAAQEGGDLGTLRYLLSLERFQTRVYSDALATGLLSGQGLRYAQKHKEHQEEHVNALTELMQALGEGPGAEDNRLKVPRLDSGTEIVRQLTAIEDVGAAAYLGAAPAVASPELLTTLVRIHSVEAYHATAWRLLAGEDPVPFAFAEGSSQEEALENLSALSLGLPRTGGGAEGLE